MVLYHKHDRRTDCRVVQHHDPSTLVPTTVCTTGNPRRWAPPGLAGSLLYFNIVSMNKLYLLKLAGSGSGRYYALFVEGRMGYELVLSWPGLRLLGTRK